jgi:hypothetical protein
MRLPNNVRVAVGKVTVRGEELETHNPECVCPRISLTLMRLPNNVRVAVGKVTVRG